MPYATDVARSAPVGRSPDEAVEWKEARVVLQQCIQDLPQTERCMVALHYGAGYKHQEIGVLLSISKRMVSYCLQGALEQVRRGFARAGLAATVLNPETLSRVSCSAPVPPHFQSRVVQGAVKKAVGSMPRRRPVLTVAGGVTESGLLLSIALGLGVLAAITGGLVWREGPSKSVVPKPTPSANRRSGVQVSDTNKSVPYRGEYTFTAGIPSELRLLEGGWRIEKGPHAKGELVLPPGASTSIAQPEWTCKTPFQLRVQYRAYRKGGGTQFIGSGFTEGKAMCDHRVWKPVVEPDERLRINGDVHRVCRPVHVLLEHALPKRPVGIARCVSGRHTVSERNEHGPNDPRLPWPRCPRFLLLGVNRYRWLPRPLIDANTFGYMLKLCIPVWMLFAFDGHPVGLQTVSLYAKQRSNFRAADVESFTNQLLRQVSHALACPTQGHHRVSSCTRFNQHLQSLNQIRLFHLSATTTAPSPPLSRRTQRFWIIELSNARSDGAIRNSRGNSHRRYATPTQRSCLSSGPTSPPSLVDNSEILLLNPLDYLRVWHTF